MSGESGRWLLVEVEVGDSVPFLRACTEGLERTDDLQYIYLYIICIILLGRPLRFFSLPIMDRDFNESKVRDSSMFFTDLVTCAFFLE